MPDQAGDHIGLFKTRQVGNALRLVGFFIRQQLRDQAGALLDIGKSRFPQMTADGPRCLTPSSAIATIYGSSSRVSDTPHVRSAPASPRRRPSPLALNPNSAVPPRSR